MNVFLCLRPNQLSVAEALHKKLGGQIIDLRTDTSCSLPPETTTLYVPYATDDALYDAAVAFLKQKPDLKIVRTFEGVGSYTYSSQDYFSSRKPEVQALGKDHPLFSHDFIGVSELDSSFQRTSLHAPLTMADIYPAASLPDALKTAKTIYIGQPLVEDGLMDKDACLKTIQDYCRSNAVDVYIRHPRETLDMNLPCPVIRLEKPLESYLPALNRDAQLASVFSSTAFFADGMGFKIAAVDMPGIKLGASQEKLLADYRNRFAPEPSLPAQGGRAPQNQPQAPR